MHVCNKTAGMTPCSEEQQEGFKQEGLDMRNMSIRFRDLRTIVSYSASSPSILSYPVVNIIDNTFPETP